MKTTVYEIADEDVLELFFGENQKYMPIWAIARDHGVKIWEGDLSLHPDAGDVLCIEGASAGVDEYMIVCRAYSADTDSSILLVHTRYQKQMGMS